MKSPLLAGFVRPPSRQESLVAERMIAQLKQDRDRERDKDLRGSYQAAIDRLDALAYRLTEAAPARADAAATPPSAPTPEPKPSKPRVSKRPAIVVARPRRGSP